MEKVRGVVLLALAVLLLGAAAQVSREEFVGLQKRVEDLERTVKQNAAYVRLLLSRKTNEPESKAIWEPGPLTAEQQRYLRLVPAYKALLGKKKAVPKLEWWVEGSIGWMESFKVAQVLTDTSILATAWIPGSPGFLLERGTTRYQPRTPGRDSKVFHIAGLPQAQRHDGQSVDLSPDELWVTEGTFTYESALGAKRTVLTVWPLSKGKLRWAVRYSDKVFAEEAKERQRVRAEEAKERQRVRKGKQPTTTDK